MKPTNDPTPRREFWCLRDERGHYYAYSNDEAGVRCCEDVRHARKYATAKGAWVAQHNILTAYGKRTSPVLFELVAREKRVTA